MFIESVPTFSLICRHRSLPVKLKSIGVPKPYPSSRALTHILNVTTTGLSGFSVVL